MRLTIYVLPPGIFRRMAIDPVEVRHASCQRLLGGPPEVLTAASLRRPLKAAGAANRP
ncbi:MAG: hypothetical protein TU35_007605 [Thermoproteus sp. AZ2]|uniref:Uncharacterized protein n=1 Tax=Thermoproteus sp. AZ2 TaxID=1609232 RepID=A0ACC6V204_9CREN